MIRPQTRPTDLEIESDFGDFLEIEIECIFTVKTFDKSGSRWRIYEANGTFFLGKMACNA